MIIVDGELSQLTAKSRASRRSDCGSQLSWTHWWVPNPLVASHHFKVRLVGGINILRGVTLGCPFFLPSYTNKLLQFGYEELALPKFSSSGVYAD